MQRQSPARVIHASRHMVYLSLILRAGRAIARQQLPRVCLMYVACPTEPSRHLRPPDAYYFKKTARFELTVCDLLARFVAPHGGWRGSHGQEPIPDQRLLRAAEGRAATCEEVVRQLEGHTIELCALWQS